MASIGAYAHADLPHAALWRLPKDSLNDLLDMPGQGADPAIIAMLYTNFDATAFPGFKAVLHQDFAAKEDNTYVLAFAGTDDSAGEMFHKQGYDWAENVWQGLGWDSFQYQYAMQAATAIQAAMERLVEDGASLTTTGHSLGGGLASAASVVTGAPGSRSMPRASIPTRSVSSLATQSRWKPYFSDTIRPTASSPRFMSILIF